MKTRPATHRRSRSPLPAGPAGRRSLGRLLRGTPRNRRVRPKQSKPAIESTDGGRPEPKRGSKRAARPPKRAPRRPLGQLIVAALLTTVRVVVAIAALGGMGWSGYQGYQFAVRSSYFTVRSVRLEGVKRSPRADLLKRLEWTKGRSIFALHSREVAEALISHPWVAEATAHRRLPGTLEIRIEEHQPKAVVLLGHLYLINAAGAVFKRASQDEAEGLPVISGIERLAYLNGRKETLHKVARALEALRLYQSAKRPPVGEIHVGDDDEITLFLRRGGTALRFGQRMSAERLHKLDAVWAALGPDTRRARAVYLDHEQRTERVVVRLARYQ